MDKTGFLYLSENISLLLGIPGRVFESGVAIKTISVVNLTYDPYEYHKQEIVWSNENVTYFVTADAFTYCRIKSNEIELIIGPFSYFAKKPQEYKELAFKMDVRKEYMTHFMSAMTSITCMPLGAVLQSLLTYNFVLNDEMKNLEEIMVKEDIKTEYSRETENQKVDTQEITQYRNSTLAIEDQLKAFVRNGDVEGFDKWVKTAPSIRAGSLSNDALRQQKNTFIVAATILSRAAIEGGLEYNEALDISDMYIQKVENCTILSEIFTINYLLVKDLVEKVRMVKANDSPLETAIANYVIANISTQIKLDDLCDALYMSKSNLCYRFKNETGKTVQQFIQEKKIEECKKLLVTSNKSIATISLYLGFSSQAHLSKAFKDQVGISPIQYRKTNKRS